MNWRFFISRLKRRFKNFMRPNTITLEILSAIMPDTPNETLLKYIGPLNKNLSRYDINTPLRIAHFLAQTAHESGGFKHTKESMNYSWQRLRVVFWRYFKTDAEARLFDRDQKGIANRVYSGRLGNGPESSGDGWTYIGAGLIQLTGRYNIEKFLNSLSTPPKVDQIATDPNIAVLAACWFWQEKNINNYADMDYVRSVTKLINGGYRGLADRKEYLKRAKKALGIG